MHKSDHLVPPATLQSTTERVKGKLHGGISLRTDLIKQQQPELGIISNQSAEGWAVQLFRSIDSDSADGFTSTDSGSFDAGLTWGKGKVIDASIHKACVHAIRRAEHYIYVENQYFLGSAHLWER